MKKLNRLGLLASILLINFFGAIKSPAQEIFTELSGSLKAGNVKEISRYFNNTVDITLPSSEDQYSRSQAEIVLKTFFNTHVPSGFSIEHQGASNNGKYMVGTLMTSKGNFKVYVFVKDSGGQKIISELKIETP